MSLVDYAAARRPVAAKMRTLQFSPGLWLAVSVMLLAVLAALFPALFTQASPIEGVAGAQRLAPQADTGSAPISLAAISLPASFTARHIHSPPPSWRWRSDCWLVPRWVWWQELSAAKLNQL